MGLLSAHLLTPCGFKMLIISCLSFKLASQVSTDAIKIVPNPSQYNRICVRKGKNKQLLVQFVKVFSQILHFWCLTGIISV